MVLSPSFFKKTMLPSFAFAESSTVLILALDLALCSLLIFLFSMVSFAISLSSSCIFSCVNWSLENRISLELRPEPRTLLLTTKVAFASILALITLWEGAQSFISFCSSCIFLSTRAKAFLFLVSPGCNVIPSSDKSAGFLMRLLSEGAWSTLMDTSLSMNGVTVEIMPSMISSRFSEGIIWVLRKPEKFSVATMIFFVCSFMISRVNASPGWLGISLG